MMPRATLALFALAVPLLRPTPAAAQIQASEHAIVAQTVDGTTITLEYSRPQVRGRELFGSLVPWGVVWTPGANWATTLEVDADMKLNGTEVPAGKYSVWAIPRPERFTVTLNPEPRIFHFMKPDSTSEQIHVSAEPQEGPHVEMLTWSFPEVTGDAATLRMEWGTTALDLQVLAPPSRPVALSAEQRSLYIGEYEVALTEGIGWPTSGALEVYEQDGRLRGTFPFPMHPGDELDFDMVPAGRDLFNPGLFHDGELFNIEMGVIFDFSEMDDDRAIAVSMRSANGFFLGEGPRAR
jgi:hypothetical protein